MLDLGFLGCPQLVGREGPQLLSHAAVFTDRRGLGAVPESRHPHTQLSRAHTLGLTTPRGALPATPLPKRAPREAEDFKEGMRSLLVCTERELFREGV